MIKEFKIFEAVKWYHKGKFDSDEKENQFEDSRDFKVGDYITVIEMPRQPHWLYDTKLKTYKLMGEPVKFAREPMWCTDGRFHDYDKPGYAGIPEECFRHATPEEIEEAY